MVRAVGCCALALSYGCGDDSRAPPLRSFEPDEAGPCEVVDAPQDYFQSEILADAEYWECTPPGVGDGPMSFLDMTGTRAMVTGGFARFDLNWAGEGDLTGREVVLWIGTLARGFYTFPAPSNDNPQHWELKIDGSVASGDYDIFVGISDARDERQRPIIGAVARAALHVIQVGSGDVQVNLNWDTQADLDLWVYEPSGEEVYWGARTSSTGGRLDLDSYADCRIENDIGRGNENVYWPLGTAPTGNYAVHVVMYAPCETLDSGTPTNYSVNVVTGDAAQTFEGTLQPTSSGMPREIVGTFAY